MNSIEEDDICSYHLKVRREQYPKYMILVRVVRGNIKISNIYLLYHILFIKSQLESLKRIY